MCRKLIIAKDLVTRMQVWDDHHHGLMGCIVLIILNTPSLIC